MVDHAPVALDGFGKLVDASARMVHFSGRFAAGFNQAASYYYGAGNADNQALRPAVAHLLAGRLPPPGLGRFARPLQLSQSQFLVGSPGVHMGVVSVRRGLGKQVHC
jgi:hypothetical protein